MQYCRSVPDPDRRHREREGGPVGIDSPWQQRQRMDGSSFFFSAGHKSAQLSTLSLLFLFPFAPNGGYPKVRSSQSSKLKKYHINLSWVSNTPVSSSVFVIFLSNLCVSNLVSMIPSGAEPPRLFFVFFLSYALVYCCLHAASVTTL